MTTPRPIRPHKGGRTARAPEARIRPQTLERIWATLHEQGVTWGDWLEEKFSGEDSMNYNEFAFQHHYYNTPGKSAYDHKAQIEKDLGKPVKMVSGKTIPANAIRVGDFTGSSGQNVYTYYITE